MNNILLESLKHGRPQDFLREEEFFENFATYMGAFNLSQQTFCPYISTL